MLDDLKKMRLTDPLGSRDTAEVHVRVEIPLNQMLGIRPGHLAVMATLDLLTEREGNATSTGAVVADAAPKGSPIAPPLTS